ncbi:Ada metal-binding domain-containing protein [Deinococcus lacus]|uniref:Ada metal-binding domain-containing protein n=1 Tax=Deinococcus lacus TaxID=392561 RepID=A0ABW1YFV3_9DEIO
MLAADAGYDGAFITGVISTGIYCLPSCRARKPKPENVVFCTHPAQAKELGLRACQRCRPDDYYAGVDLTERHWRTQIETPRRLLSGRSLARVGP